MLAGIDDCSCWAGCWAGRGGLSLGVVAKARLGFVAKARLASLSRSSIPHGNVA